MHRLSRSSLPRPSNLPEPTPPNPDPTTDASSVPKSKKRPRSQSSLHLPRPPKPLPPLDKRYSEYSPAVPGGHFLNVLKGEKERENKVKKERLEASGGKEPVEEVAKQIEGGEEGGKKKKEKKEKVKMVRQGKR